MTLPPYVLGNIEGRLQAVDSELAQRYPGDRAGQPIHTVYVSAADATPSSRANGVRRQSNWPVGTVRC